MAPGGTARLRKQTAVQRPLWLRVTLWLHRAQGERSEKWARVEVLWTLAHPPCQRDWRRSMPGADSRRSAYYQRRGSRKSGKRLLQVWEWGWRGCCR